MAVSPLFAVGANPPPPLHLNRLPTASRHHANQTKPPLSLPAQDPILHLLDGCRSIHQFPPVHALIVKSGRHRDALLLFKLLRLCYRWNAWAYAEDIFESITLRDVYHYTAFLEGKITSMCYRDAIHAFSRMLQECLAPDSFVFVHVVRACALEMALEEGRQVHSMALKLGQALFRPIRMRLGDFYCQCGEFRDARKVFDGMPEKDPVAATIFVSSLCSHGSVEEAYRMFEAVEEKDTVCWTAMINGFVRNDHANDALRLFRNMQEENVKPNEVTIVCILSACSKLGALELGRWVHSYARTCDIKLNDYVHSSLIDMYSTCGSLEEAWDVFKGKSQKSVVAYNSMIRGFALNGRSDEAVQLFNEMIDQGVKPGSITFVSVLNACSHGGMVDLGSQILHDMNKIYEVEPQMEHYGCIVDLLGRAGRVEEAYDFVKSLKMGVDRITWMTLLGACKLHRNLILAEEIAQILIDRGLADDAIYVLLANIYASFGKWEKAERMRSLMKTKGIQKEPGCSSIEVGGTIHEFLSGDLRHPTRKQIYEKLREMNEALKLEGYTPAKEVVLQDIDDKDKEWALSIHSEKLAICYGLISTEPGSTIRVVKNLRICNDCHSMIKLMSMLTGRKIAVRDRKRFHHFENGSCSCGDYW